MRICDDDHAHWSHVTAVGLNLWGLGKGLCLLSGCPLPWHGIIKGLQGVVKSSKKWPVSISPPYFKTPATFMTLLDSPLLLFKESQKGLVPVKTTHCADQQEENILLVAWLLSRCLIYKVTNLLTSIASSTISFNWTNLALQHLSP